MCVRRIYRDQAPFYAFEDSVIPTCLWQVTWRCALYGFSRYHRLSPDKGHSRPRTRDIGFALPLRRAGAPWQRRYVCSAYLGGEESKRNAARRFIRFIRRPLLKIVMSHGYAARPSSVPRQPFPRWPVVERNAQACLSEIGEAERRRAPVATQRASHAVRVWCEMRWKRGR